MVDRYAKTQEGFEKRLGRARKTMAYRAQVRNAQVPESRARQIILQQLHLSQSRSDLDLSVLVSSGADGTHPSLTRMGSKDNFLALPQKNSPLAARLWLGELTMAVVEGTIGVPRRRRKSQQTPCLLLSFSMSSSRSWHLSQKNNQ